ncbi:MAG: hypothetical protein WBA82_07900 [Castellaniella sp.]|uniref:hypothetical protein n=1 Tax=Castellaniella sp. TaxID=1955812 RepID=UPI003C720D53
MSNQMAALPMTPQVFVGEIMEPALDLLPAKMGSIEARIMLLAIALQESGLAHRWQVVDRSRPWIKGPARGLLQFERGGGVKGVLTHAASRDYAADVCLARGVVAAPQQVYDALDRDDILAVALGRLLLWTDPRALPAVGDHLGAWNLYQRVWRPGRPHPNTWLGHYRAACAALGAA